MLPLTASISFFFTCILILGSFSFDLCVEQSFESKNVVLERCYPLFEHSITVNCKYFGKNLYVATNPENNDSGVCGLAFSPF